MRNNPNSRSSVLLSVLFVLAASACSDSTSSQTDACLEPENPYNDGGGHDAGFKWAEENGPACDGNSDSFNEGCQEFFRQSERYEACQAEKH